MPKRISITVKDDIDLFDAVERVGAVIHRGRISGKSFCYHTEYLDGECLDGIVVSANTTKAGNDTFTVYRKGKKNGKNKT